MSSDIAEIPDYFIAAARLGAAKQLGEALVVSVFDGLRHLYLAEHVGRLVSSIALWVDLPGSHALAMDGGSFRVREPVSRRWLDHYRVREYLGGAPEGQRSTALADAYSIGCLVLRWPGERLGYWIEYPGQALPPWLRQETPDEQRRRAELDTALAGPDAIELGAP